MPRRRKRRRVVRGEPIVWLLLIANVGAGLAFSPVTSADRLTVIGAQTADERRLRALAQRLRDIPCLRVNADAVESRVLSLPEIDQARLVRNVFRRAVLEVSYREPVAMLKAFPNVAIDGQGLLFRTLKRPEGLPSLEVPPEAMVPALTFCAGWQSAAVADLCRKLGLSEMTRSFAVRVYPRGSVSLETKVGSHINLGPAERMDEKLGKLEEILRERPGILAQVTEINLVSPSHPVMDPRPRGVLP